MNCLTAREDVDFCANCVDANPGTCGDMVHHHHGDAHPWLPCDCPCHGPKRFAVGDSVEWDIRVQPARRRTGVIVLVLPDGHECTYADRQALARRHRASWWIEPNLVGWPARYVILVLGQLGRNVSAR